MNVCENVGVMCATVCVYLRALGLFAAGLSLPLHIVGP